MCGIAGAVGDVDPDVEVAVRRMSDAMVHRGPDAAGLWSDVPGGAGRGVVLAHRRLKILDLSSAANQPMRDPASGNVVVFNGEIYNFRALRSRLEAAGRPFATQSDTEVLLQGFGQMGAGIAGELRGMFAAALWDAARRELTLVRDRFGMKPLYFAEIARSGGRRVHLFASEVRALLASGMLAPRLSRGGLASYLWNGFVSGPDTIVDGVQCLPAATVATIDAESLTMRSDRYWLPPRDEPGGASVEDLRATLAGSVSAHLQSDVPLGVFLSGGIDSSAVASLAVQTSGTAVQTFHISFDEPEFDESAYAREVARRLGSVHVDVRLSEARFRDGLSAALGSLDQPTFDGINSYFVSRAVREAGITVALAGTGGDELFGGYASFRDIPRTRRVSRLMKLLPASVAGRVAEFAAGWIAGSGGGVPPQTRAGKLVDIVGTRGGLVELYQVQYALFTSAFQGDLSSPRVPLLPYGMGADRLAELRDQAGRGSLRHTISILEFAMFLEQRLLRDTDAASMASSLEVRVPLIDHEVFETVSRLPAEVRFGPETKRALREAAMPGLPRELFDRPKSGFVLPIEAWCRAGLGAEVQATLSEPGLIESLGLDPSAVGRLWKAFQERSPGIYWSRIWSIFVLAWWVRRHGLTLADR